MIAGHTLHSGSTFLDWTRAYAVTIDESAWIILLILFEMETYLINNPLSRAKAMLMLVVRLCCYGFLAHSLCHIFYAYELNQAQVVEALAIFVKWSDRMFPVLQLGLLGNICR